MIKETIKTTLDNFNKLMGEDDLTPYLSFYNLIIRSLNSDDVNTLIIKHQYSIDFFDDLKIVSLSDKEVNFVIEQHRDDEDEYGFIDSIFYYITVDKIGNVLRVKDIQRLQSDEGYEFIDENVFDDIFQNI